MRFIASFIAHFAVLFYVTVILSFGFLMALFVFHWISFDDTVSVLQVIYYAPQMRQVFGIVAVMFLLMNYIYARAISHKGRREKTIAFDNPDGRVTVSVSTLEDLIKKIISKSSEVRDVRAAIKIGKTGLEIDAKLVLSEYGNIPEMTSRLQDLVKKRVQETIGIEGTIVVRIDVTKIIPNERKEKKAKNVAVSQEEIEPAVPFQGYRA